ncbi:MAG TPA: GGDEF domain-containing protein [Xanthobacteraceae bacterium]|jgi:diguanylate cyclase (GGDEF)-like protein|nr:GGDEF domain-containing protein [Xanthobacteraceae bacterium]HQS47527.1 GGDEF domain-containing protein [Xanthobacteraceae bacterium]
MPSEPHTLFALLVLTAAIGACLQIWAWSQARSERLLLWGGIAYAFITTGILLNAAREALPALFSQMLGTGLVIYGGGLIYAAARAFNGRQMEPLVAVAGAVMWLVACQFPDFYANTTGRITLASVLLAGYCAAAAFEFLRAKGLPSRILLAALLIVHGIGLLLRIPLALAQPQGPVFMFANPWFIPIALENVLMLQLFAFLLVTLTKEKIAVHLRQTADTDALTGLPNRRALFVHAVSALARDARRARPSAVIVFDLDRFKYINDTYGHPVGDAVLLAFASAATTQLRAGDMAGRIGGEEFAVLLPETDGHQAAIAARRIMVTFTHLSGMVEGCESLCTASAGIASTRAGSAANMETLLHAADRALYDAKREGHNRLSVAPPIDLRALATPQ